MRTSIKVKILICLLVLILLIISTYAATFRINTNTKFNKGTYNNTYYNTANQAVQINNNSNGNYISKIFTTNYLAEWQQISWTTNKTGEITNQETNGLILLMHLNEQDGIIQDYSGQENNGTYNGNLYSQTGKINTAIGFDGTDYIKIERTDNPELDPKEASVAAWAKNTAHNDNYMKYILCRAGGSQGCSYGMYFNDGLSNDNLGIEIRTQDGGKIQEEWTWTGMNEEWFHTALTFSNNNNGTAILYLNANPVATWTNLGTNLTHRTQYSNDDLYIGAKDTGNNVKAIIDEAAVWNRTLTETEIKEFYKRAIVSLNISIKNNEQTEWQELSGESPQTLSINNSQYFQVKAEFSTENSNYSPYLYDATIHYSILPDTTKPSVFELIPAKESLFETGEQIEISANITDDREIDTAYVIITNSDNTQQIQLTKQGTTDKYNASYIITATDRYNITFIANDTSGNTNSTETTWFSSIVLDTIPPSVNNITPLAGTNFSKDSRVDITADVTDNIMVDTVFASITHPDLSVILLQLFDDDNDNIYNNSIIANQQGWYHVTIIANDTSGNINNTEGTNFDPASLGGGGGGGGVASQSYKNIADWRKKLDTSIITPQECMESWLCNDWSECTKEGKQTRECDDWNKCGTDKTKPITEKECEYSKETKEDEPRFATSLLLPREQTIKTVGGTGIAAIIILLGTSIYLLYRKTNKKRKTRAIKRKINRGTIIKKLREAYKRV
ncbi:LamG domain-containing protein [Candidatus Woesearchaeota archaeon]|nr:LamG domain-containing protein [Candidatus Woesearchaeota archaeon]